MIYANMTFNKEYIEQLCTFSTSRSCGPGGQNVNKVETKVEARISIDSIEIFTFKQKELSKSKLANKLIDGDILLVTCQEARSQVKNKEMVVKKIIVLLKEAIQVDKDRISTIPTKESREKRIKSKKIDGDRKTNRGNLKNKFID